MFAVETLNTETKQDEQSLDNLGDLRHDTSVKPSTTFAVAAPLTSFSILLSPASIWALYFWVTVVCRPVYSMTMHHLELRLCPIA